MSRVKDMINALEYEDLIKLKKDLVNYKGLHLKKLVEERIKQIEQEHRKYCATCLTKIEPESTDNFTLIFGPASFRKKASFCGIDCLQYFLEKLKKMKKETILKGGKNEN